MSSMLATIVPKSDQLNADDLIGGVSKTIKVTGVSILAGDQPVSLSYEGDNGKPYKPCKSMRRVLVQIWGSDGNAYVGQRMTLYRDENVKFGGANVGGIRISHMSGITEPVTMALTATRAQRKPYTVKPLVGGDAPKPTEPPPDTTKIDEAIALCKLTTNPEELETLAKDAGKLKGWTPAKQDEMKAVLKQRRAEFKQQTEDRQPGE